MRRLIGKSERQQDGSWIIGPDHLPDAESYEREKSRRLPARIEMLSARPLEQLPTYDGATWLDREISNAKPERLAGGFGVEVRQALAQRSAWLVEQGLAEQDGNSIRTRSNLLALLQRREMSRIIADIEKDAGFTHVRPVAGERIEGTYRVKPYP